MKYIIILYSILHLLACRKPPIICVSKTTTGTDTIALGGAIYLDASCTNKADMITYVLSKNVDGAVVKTTRGHLFDFIPTEPGLYKLKLSASKNRKTANDKPVATSTEDYYFYIE